MVKTINIINEDNLEIVEETTTTNVKRYSKSELEDRKDRLNDDIADINTLLLEFDK